MRYLGIMRTKQDIVTNWLPRYTGMQLDDFGSHILLTNFSNYLEKFAEWNGCEIVGREKAMPCATADDTTMINFGMGSANAATVMDLLSAIAPKAVLFLGKCGALKEKTASVTSSCRWPGFAARGRPMTTSHRGSGLAELRIAARHLLNRSGLQSGLLHGVGVHHQPPGMGTRRCVQSVPAQHAGASHRHGDGHPVQCGIRKSVVGRGVAARKRRAHDPIRRENRCQRRQSHGILVDEHIRIGIDSLKEIQSKGGRSNT